MYRSTRFRWLVLLSCLLSPASTSLCQADDVASQEVSFKEDIEPILRRNCYGCHQGAKQQGAYLMTDFDSLIKGGETGEAAIVPGKPDESYLLSQIELVDGVAEMPKPPSKPLDADEVELIRRWISNGAVNDSPAADEPLFSPASPPVYTNAPAITALDVSPDGTKVAVAGYHEILLVDPKDGSLLNRLVGMSPRINAVAFSPDGSRLAAVGGTPGVEGEVQLWDPASGELTLSVSKTFDTLAGIAWSPDGAKLAFGAADNTVRAIETQTGQQVLFQGAHEDWIRDVAFTNDGKHVVSVARDMSCKLTEVETERFIDNITSITPGALSGGLNQVVVHPARNEIIVGGADGIAKVYRIFRETARKIGDDANLVRKLPAMQGRIFGLALNSDATRIAAVATIDGESEISVWAYDFDGTLTDEIKKIIAKRVNERSAAEKALLAKHQDTTTTELSRLTVPQTVYCVAFTPDNTLLFVGSDGEIQRISPDGDLVGSLKILPESETRSQDSQSFDASSWLATLPETPKQALREVVFESIEVTPAAASIASPYEYTQLVVTGVTSDGERIDVTRACELSASNGLAVHQQGLVTLNPSSPMQADQSIEVALGDFTASVKLAVVNPAQDAVDFIRDVNPVLSRLGCNQGTCHGAQKGKNGFKLSLRGYDPLYDLRALTDDLAARRINPAAPEQSLMLRKPLGLTPHEGGVLMDKGDPYHAILRRWIADGSQLDLETPRVTRLEIFPNNPVVQTVGTQQQVRLVAHFADGQSRDVTREAFIESGNTEVAKAERGGLLTAVRRGEAAILARYEGNYVASTLTVMGDRSGYQESPVETWGTIDEWVAEKWARVKVQPSPLSDDAAFLRRVTLDLTGLPPTSEKVREFLADSTPTREKREREVDQLLASDAYVDYWTNKWADLLQVNRKFLGVEGSKKFREWIRTAVQENRPYDEFAQQILTASGSNRENPAASYFKVLRNPEDTMENTTHLFLGIRFNCNKCHDHPFERWTQDQYFELAAFFSQVQLKADPESKGKKIGGTAVEGAKPLYEIVVDSQQGDVKHGRTGKVVAPKHPYEVDFDSADKPTRRELLADWMTDADNPYFARSYVNRLWGYLLGVGLIEPIDDIRAGNPPTNPGLLDHLTQRFVDSGFDTRSILREICNSRTYQLSVETNALNEDDVLNYSHAMPRRLPAEVIYDAVHRLTGATSQIPGMPAGTRAAAVTDSGVKLADGFLQNLGRPVRESACECERSSELQLGPIMALVGGPTIAGAISDPKNELEKIVADNPDDRQLAEELFLRSLGRPPTDAELDAFDQIKRRIDLDHQSLIQQLAEQEALWKAEKAKREATREQELESTRKKLAEQIEAAKPEQERLAKEREQRIQAAKEALAKVDSELEQRLDQWGAEHASQTEWFPLRPVTLAATNKATLVANADRSITASKEAGKGVYTIDFQTSLPMITGLRLEALSDESLPGGGPGLPSNGNFVVTEFEVDVADTEDAKKFRDVAIASGKADFLQSSFSIEATFDGNKRNQGGWAVSGATGLDHWATFRLAKPIENATGCTLRIQIHQFHNAGDHRLGKFRISATNSTGELPLGLPETYAAIVSTPKPQRAESSTQVLLNYVRKTDAKRVKAAGAVAAASKPVPRDAETVRLEKRIERLSIETPDDPRIVRLRSDVEQSKQQVERLRLTAAEDLTWALINSPAFLFNH
ncbi:MAG: DUF1549 domain-containing protein [Planctomycetota bacterium]